MKIQKILFSRIQPYETLDRDLRLPQVPEAPVDTHRPREATAVGGTTKSSQCGKSRAPEPEIALGGSVTGAMSEESSN